MTTYNKGRRNGTITAASGTKTCNNKKAGGWGGGSYIVVMVFDIGALEPKAIFNNKGSTYRGGEEERNNTSMSQRRYAITKGEHRSLHNTNKQKVQYQ